MNEQEHDRLKYLQGIADEKNNGIGFCYVGGEILYAEYITLLNRLKAEKFDRISYTVKRELKAIDQFEIFMVTPDSKLLRECLTKIDDIIEL